MCTVCLSHLYTLLSILYVPSFKIICGFPHIFRVQPYVSLNYLRDHIEEQLGAEVVPEDYVFLRSVGRCMAVVSFLSNQADKNLISAL